MLLRLLQGIGASGISVMARVLIRDSFRGDLLAKALSWISISFVVALGIGQYLGSIIEVTLGWQAIFYLLGVVCLVMALIVSRVAFPAVTDEPISASSWSAYRLILLHRAFLLPALAGGLGYGVIIAFNTAAPLVLQGAVRMVDGGLRFARLANQRGVFSGCAGGQSLRVAHRSGVVDDRWRRSGAGR